MNFGLHRTVIIGLSGKRVELDAPWPEAHPPKMATGEDLRSVALNLPKAAEKPHFDRTSFRVDVSKGRIFATMPDNADTANLKLTPEQQDMLCQAEPSLFSPVPGKWGESGWTVMQLGDVDAVTLESALTMAWKSAAPEKLWSLLN